MYQVWICWGGGISPLHNTLIFFSYSKCLSRTVRSFCTTFQRKKMITFERSLKKESSFIWVSSIYFSLPQKTYIVTTVSYTHLDVYKRQIKGGKYPNFNQEVRGVVAPYPR